MVYATNMTELEVLEEAARIASSLCSKLSDLNVPLSQHQLPANVDSLIPELVLTVPHDVVAPMSTLEVPQRTREALFERLNRFIEDLRQQYHTTYRHSCLVTLRGTNSAQDLSSVHRAFQALSQRQFIPTIRAQVSFIVAEVAKYRTRNSDSKRNFNNEFTPVLEKYFEYNGYPSVLHRSILAQKSGMTPRQIEVWFQNHRKRSKQDGKVVRRLESDIPLKRAFDALPLPKVVQHNVIRALSPADDGKNASSTEAITNSQLSVLEYVTRPPYAYPTPWRPDNPDAFPTDNGVYRFPPPIWRRKPATIPIIPVAIDMDEFTRQFHMRLNFVNNIWKRESTSPKVHSPSFTPWYAPFRTIPPSAPLPALQRPPALTAVSTSMLTSTIAKDPFTFVFPKTGESCQREQSNVTCIVRLPVGPQQSASSISERIERSVDTLDRERKGFRIHRRALHSPRPSTSRLASPGEIAGRKGTPTSRRGPSGVQAFGSRSSSFTSDTSSSSDDSPSPSTPPPMSIHNLHSDPAVESDNFAANFNSLFEVPSSPSFNFAFSKSPSDAQSLSPKFFNLTFASPIKTNTEPLPSRTFDFTFSRHVADRHPSTCHQNHTPLIFT